MKKILAIMVLGGTVLTLPACNTVRGAAADVESVGDCVDGQPNNC